MVRGGLSGSRPAFLNRSLFQIRIRDVGRESGAVDLALVSRDVLVGLGDGSVVRVRLQVGGEVGQKSGLHEIGHVDQVKRHEVGNLARLNSGGELGDHLVVRDGGQLDFVGVGRIPEIDEMGGGVGSAGAHPHRHRVGESWGRNGRRADQQGGERAAGCPRGHDFLPGNDGDCLVLTEKSSLPCRARKAFPNLCTRPFPSGQGPAPASMVAEGPRPTPSA